MFKFYVKTKKISRQNNEFDGDFELKKINIKSTGTSKIFEKTPVNYN